MKQGYTTDCDRAARQTCEAFFKRLQGDDAAQLKETGDFLRNLLTECLASISRDRIK
jgi:hypothetical protein